MHMSDRAVFALALAVVVGARIAPFGEVREAGRNPQNHRKETRELFEAAQP